MSRIIKILKFLRPERIPGFAAGFYDKMASKAIAEYYKEVAKEIASEMKSGKILDIGTGPGYLPIEIVKRAEEVQVVGIDLTKKMIEIARRNAREAGVEKQLSFEVGNGNKLQFEDEVYDIVISTGSLHHWRNPVRVLNECYRVLKRGKEAWIYDFCKDASEEEIKALQEKIFEKLEVNWLLRKWLRFGSRREIKIDAYAVKEISEIIEKTKFEDYGVEKRGIFMKIMLIKSRK